MLNSRFRKLTMSPADFSRTGTCPVTSDLRFRLSLCLFVGALLISALPLKSQPDVPFTHVIVDPNTEPNLLSKAVGDVNGDGYPDIIASMYGSSAGIYWYEYPTWTKHLMVAGGFGEDMQLGDVDGDGDLDAIVVDGTGVLWLENPGPLSVAGPWTVHMIGALGKDAHDLEIGDIDRDGKLDVVTRQTDVGLYVWFQDTPSSWTSILVDSAAGEGTALGDIDGDGDLDIGQGGYWIETPSSPRTGAWQRHEIAPGWGRGVGVTIADVNADGHMDVIMAPSEYPNGKLVWYESATPKTGPWTEHLIDDSVSFLHTFKTADMDGDGNLDIVTAEEFQADPPQEISVYFNLGGGLSWHQQVIATTGSFNIRVADIDLDGDIDIVGANWNRAASIGNPLELWRNELSHRLSLDLWQRHVVDAAKPWRSTFVTSRDLDLDGKKDILTGGWWYRNPGSPGGNWVRNTIGSPLNNVAAVADYDGDGIPDVLGTQGVGDTSNASFAWAKNDGTGKFTIFTNVANGQGDYLQGAAVQRFQYGGPLETALSWHSGGGGMQFLTTPAAPTETPWPWLGTASPSQADDLSAGDLDRDGKTDLLLGTIWLRNGGSGWTPFTLNPASGVPSRNRIADINLDGRPDAVVTFQDGRLAWYEQPATSDGTWTEHLIANLVGPLSLDVADMDHDGDTDIVVGEYNPGSPASARLIIFENVDRVGGSWAQHVIFTGDEHYHGAQLVDIDNDGDLDVISIGWDQGNVILYENKAIDHIPFVAAPQITPNGGSYFGSAQVTLTTSTIGASIFYTTDGSPPGQSSTPYTSPFTLTANATVNAVAIRVGIPDSPISSASFIVSVTPPEASLPPAGPKLWLKADAGITETLGAVSQWTDQSGNDTNAAQNDTTRRPMLVSSVANGRPVVRFDGIDDFLTFSLHVNDLTGMTVALVSDNSVDMDGGASGTSNAALSWNETASWTGVNVSPFQSRVKFRFGTTQNLNSPSYSRPFSVDGNLTMTEVIKNNDIDSLYVQGQLALSEGGKLSAISSSDVGNLGCGCNDNTYFSGQIAEVLVYDRALSEPERQQLELYLRDRYFNQNQPPQVNAGSDQIVTYPAVANLTGTAQDEGLPSNTLALSWSQASGPGTVAFGTPNSSSTTASFSKRGSYILRFSATDGALSTSDDVAVLAATPGPTNLLAAPGNAQVGLSWTGVAWATSYNVKRATVNGGPYTLIASGGSATNYLNTGLANGTTYYYVVSASNAEGESLDSVQTTTQPFSSPAVPASLTALPDNAQVSLHWAPSAGADGYNVKRSSASGGPYITIAAGMTSTTLLNTGLINGTTYYYVVTASNGAGESANSPEAAARPDIPIPSCPTCRTIFSAAATPKIVNNTDPNSVELGMQFRSDLNGFIRGIRFYKGIGNTGTHVGSLWNLAGTSLGTATFAGEIASGWQIAWFATPVPITANTTYVASYHAPVGNYSVDLDYFAAAGLDNAPLHALSNGAAVLGNGLYRYANNSVIPNSTYHSSNYWVDVVFDTTAPPGAPTGLTATPGNGQVTLSWTAAAGAASYTVKQGTAPGGPYTTIASPTTPGAVSGGLTNGTPYYYVVSATNGAGEGPNSAEASATPTTAPPAPTGLTATAGNGQVTLSWTGVAGATSYNVKQGTASGGPYTTIASPTTPGAVSGGLTNGTTYYYVVTAVNGNGESGSSVQASATPVTAPAGCGTCVSIWNASATPGVAASGDGTSVELGVKFRSEVSGSIKGIRFYKGANNTGTHIGNLWTSAGALLGTATFANEAATGWQQVLFASPIVIAANTTYVASYFAPNGNFASDGNYFTAAGVDNPPLHALSAVAGGGNGVFVYRASSGFPNSTYQGYNYWVDVVFDSSPTAPPAPTGLTATAGNGQVTLSWTGVAGATSYNVKQGTASGGPYTTIASPTTPGAVSGGLTNGTTYYYVVTAVNGLGEGPNSAEASATPTAVPPAPTGLTATAEDGQVTLNWTPVAGTTSYNVKQGTANGGPYPNVFSSASARYVNQGLTNGTTYYYVVTAVNGGFESGSSAQASATPTAPPAGCGTCVSIWNGSTTPAVANSGGAAAVELGVKFKSDVSGSIKGIRFYKGTNNTGTHVGNLWTAAGALLGTATITNETVSGWQQVLFASPIAINANTTYVASYFAPNGNFASDGNYFTAAGVDTPPLHALSAAAGGGNGVFAYRASSGFPNSTYQGYNYWVDVLLDTSGGAPIPPPAPAGLTATPGSGLVILNWTAVSGATSYNLKQGTANGGPYTTIASPNSPGYLNSGLTNGTTYYYVVTAVSGNGESGNSAQASADPAAAPTGCGTCVSIWNASAIPAVAANADFASVELGVKFRSEVSGFIKGVRFYKGPGNTGTHIGNVWTTAGTLLAAATFTNETATGWQQVLFAAPVAVTANTTYVVSYFAPNGHYGLNLQYFATTGVDTPPLHALSSAAAGGNGLFTYRATSGFPANTYQAANYWVDVLFDTTN